MFHPQVFEPLPSPAGFLLKLPGRSSPFIVRDGGNFPWALVCVLGCPPLWSLLVPFCSIFVPSVSHVCRPPISFMLQHFLVHASVGGLCLFFFFTCGEWYYLGLSYYRNPRPPFLGTTIFGFSRFFFSPLSKRSKTVFRKKASHTSPPC